MECWVILFQAAAAKTFIICKSPKDEDVFKSAFENNEHITYFNNEKEKDLRYKVNSLSDEDYRDITSRARAAPRSGASIVFVAVLATSMVFTSVGLASRSEA